MSSNFAEASEWVEYEDDFFSSHWILKEIIPARNQAPNEPKSEEANWGATGVDTLKLFYPVRAIARPKFFVRSKAQVQTREKQDFLLWRNPDGSFARGVMAVRREGAIRFRVASVGTEVKLRVFFSVPRVVGERFSDRKSNSYAVSQNELQTVLEFVQQKLLEFGFQIDWREGQLSRIDVHRDVSLQRPFAHYQNALELIDPPYGRIFLNYASGVQRGSPRGLRWSLYDKPKQLQAKGEEEKNDKWEKNGWLRCEARLSTAISIQKQLGIKTAGELVAHYPTLSSWLSRKLDREVFPKHGIKYSANQGENTTIPELYSSDWWAKQLSSAADNRVTNLLAYTSYRQACATIGPEAFWKMVKDRDLAGASVPKQRQKFRRIGLASFSDQSIPMAQLYDELRAALLVTD